MTTSTSVSKDILGHDFLVSTYGKLEQPKIDAAIDALKAQTTAYGATGNVASMVFYLKFQVHVSGGKAFNGHAGGLSSPGGGALFGDVYTDDVNALYSNTVSFQFNATPVYLSVLFFDKHSHLLGHFQSGGISTVLGTGGGSGHWS